MMLWIVGILCALMVLGFFLNGVDLSVVVGVPLGLLVLWNMFEWHSHCNELAVIRNSESMIAVHTQAIEDLNAQMSDLNKSMDNKTLFNADSPYRSLIQAKSHYVYELSKARVAVVNVKISIMARKLGLMSHIVRWVGEE